MLRSNNLVRRVVLSKLDVSPAPCEVPSRRRLHIADVSLPPRNSRSPSLPDDDAVTDAHHGKQQSQSYRPQSSNSQNRAGGGGGGYGGPDYGYGASANGSSYAQERGYGDVEGKMGNLGINGGGNGNGAQGSADQMSVDTDMADGSNGQYGGNGGGYQQQQQSAVSRHHQQQQQGGGGHHSHASRQLARQTETTPQVVLSPTPSQSSSVSRKTSSRYSLTDFTFIRTLGTGSFGRVHLVRSQHNGRSYAIKVLSKERVVKMKQVEHTNSEREMLERVRHPFLVNLWGTFKDSKNLYMVMDFVAGGELFSLLRKSQVRPLPSLLSLWSRLTPSTYSASPTQ